MDAVKEELRQLRGMVEWLGSCVRTLAKKSGQEDVIETLNRAVKRWHEHRTKRFDQEKKDAEAVLEKAAQIEDYGVWENDDKFVQQGVAQSLRRRVKELEAERENVTGALDSRTKFAAKVCDERDALKADLEEVKEELVTKIQICKSWEQKHHFDWKDRAEKAEVRVQELEDDCG